MRSSVGVEAAEDVPLGRFNRTDAAGKRAAFVTPHRYNTTAPRIICILVVLVVPRVDVPPAPRNGRPQLTKLTY